MGEGAPRRVVILGAGLGGLSAAWVLVRNGYSVLLLEKTDGAGGLAVTKTRGGYKYDLGPHNIHSVHDHIIAFLKRHFTPSFFEHAPRSKILKRGKFVDYPLRGIKVITSLPLWKLPFVGISFFLARVRMFLREPKVDHSFEEWITNRFGRLLFGEYFGPYAGKVWGLPPGEIDRYVAEKRVPVIHLTELVRAALFGKTAGANHPEFQAHNYYLKHGIGETVEFFRTNAEAAGARIVYGVDPERVCTADGRVIGVTYRSGDGRTEHVDAEYVLSTIPLDAAVPLFDEAPEHVRRAAAALDYCASVLLFLEIGRRGILPSAMLYLSDPKVRFSRVYDVGMYSSEMVPAGKTMLCIEFPCTVGDAIWNEPDVNLTTEAIATLSDCGVLRTGDVEGNFCERISHSYPRFRVGFEGRLKDCFDFFAAFNNFISYGRQGSFAYVNTDNVINMGFRAASSIMAAESMDYTCYEWFVGK